MLRKTLDVTRAAFTSSTVLFTAFALLTACAKHDGAPAADSAAQPSASASAATASTGDVPPTDITPVRGTVSSLSDTALTITTAKGPVQITVQPPLHVFVRASAKLASVTPSTFVGVTSVAQSDGSQRATEIHIFPEELRGTGEGSYLMQPQPGADTSSAKRSTMTNGTVSAAPKSGSAPRMTNGTIASAGTGTLVVNYRGGSQTIVIPPDVSVTQLAPSTSKVAQGAKVVVLAKKQPDGTMRASSLVVADSAGAKQ